MLLLPIRYGQLARTGLVPPEHTVSTANAVHLETASVYIPRIKIARYQSDCRRRHARGRVGLWLSTYQQCKWPHAAEYIAAPG